MDAFPGADEELPAHTTLISVRASPGGRAIGPDGRLKALTDPAARAKLGDEAARRYQALLDDQVKWTACIYSERSADWFSGAAWQAMNEKLFDAAAEVTAKLGAK